MFGAKYSRKKYWIILISLLIPIIFLKIMATLAESKEDSNSVMIIAVGYFIIAFIQLNTLANRIRDYGSNPWLSLLALIPLVNIVVSFYYGIVRYKEKPADNKTTTNSDTSLTKAVYNHAKDIAAEAKPAISEYKQKHATSQTQAENQHIDLVDEDAIYEQVMIEIEEDRKVKSAWAKALAQSGGDASKETSLYIQLRVSDIIEKNKNEIELEKQKIKAQRSLEVWLDSKTELMWEIKTEENIKHRYVWSEEDVENAQNLELLTDDVKDAFSYADKLNRNRFGGYDDWRVPTKEELKTLLTNRESKIEGFNGKNYFIKDELSKNCSSYYWSSTTYEGYKNDAWNVYFDDGYVGNDGKDGNYYVRCVRAGQ